MTSWEAIAAEIRSHVAAMNDQDTAAAIDLCASINLLFANTSTANVNRLAAILLIARVCAENMAEAMGVSAEDAAHALGHVLHDSLSVRSGCRAEPGSVH